MIDFSINIYALILGLTLIQAVVFAIILCVRGYRNNNYSDYLLALLLILLGLTFVPDLFGWLNIHVLWNEYIFYPWDGFELAVLPTAMLFLRSRLNAEWRFKWKDLKLYWLYILYCVYHLIIGLQGKEYAKWWWYEVNNKYNIDAVFSFCNLGLFIYFLIDFNKTYQSYQTWSANRFSDLSPLSISWIRNFLIAYFVFIAINMALTLMSLIIGVHYEKMWWAYLLNLGITYYISIYGYSQRPINNLNFQLNEDVVSIGEELNSSEDENIDTTFKKQEPIMDEAELLLWKDKLNNYFVDERPYLNPDLRLAELANHFQVNISTLSTIINQCFDKNFNDLVNEYRVNAFCKNIEAGQLSQFTLLSIAYDAGFNSKTTFNRAFKKQLGMSPSDYVKLQKGK
jgi:AraC-like DNA-binding protein